LKLPDSSKKTFTQYSRSDLHLPRRLALNRPARRQRVRGGGSAALMLGAGGMYQ
jgi:hypothetical protein